MLTITKLQNAWRHEDDNKEIFLSHAYLSLKENSFKLTEFNGATLIEKQLSEITLVDETLNFTYPTFTTGTEFWATLNELNYFVFNTPNVSVSLPPIEQPTEPSPIPFETQDILNVNQLTPPHVLGFNVIPSSELPMIDTPKNYIVFYGTDHAEGAYGAGGLWIGHTNTIDCADLEEVARVHAGYQAETPFPIAIGNELFLYYHTNASDPAHVGTQQTHLMTTTGGDINNLSWTQRGTPLGLETGENHTGYLKSYDIGNTYKAIHLTRGGIPQNYYFSTSTDGLTFTRDDQFNRTVDLPTGFQYKGTTGRILPNLYGYNWAIMNIVPEDFQGNTTFGLIKLDENLQPIEYCRDLHDGDGVPIALNKGEGDIEVMIEDNIANIYWKEGDIVKLKRYDLSDLENYAVDPPVTYPPNTISAYNFNGNAGDQVSNSDGTAINVVYANNSAIFNGNSSIIFNDSSDFELNNIGVEFTMNTSDDGTGLRALVVKQFAYGIFIHDDILKLFSWDGTGFIDTGVNIVDGTDHTIRVEFKNGIENETFVFVDDELVLTTTYNFSNQTKNLAVGNGDDGTVTPPSGQHYNGTIKDLRIFIL